MKKHIVFLFIIFLVCNFTDAFSNASADSVGVVTVKGKKYIVHEVEAGETLFALSRKYNVDIQAIKDANTESVTSLSIGQKVNIPTNTKQSNDKATYHVVKASETLYSVSRQYDVTVDELVMWNNLTDNSISVGQRLMVSEGSNKSTTVTVASASPKATKGKTHTVAQSQTLYAISRIYGVSTDQIRSWNDLTTDDLYIGQILIVSDGSVAVPAEQNGNSSMLPAAKEDTKQPTQNSAKIPITTGVVGTTSKEAETFNDNQPSEKVVQKGFAEVIENTNETKKYLALHRTAPQGTIMQVRNEMNNQSVFVRIVGTIPATGDNSKVILKISKKAYDRLGAVDARFPVEISYIP